MYEAEQTMHSQTTRDVLLICQIPSLQCSRYRRRARQYRSATWDPSKTLDQDVADLEGVLKTSLSLWWTDDLEINGHDDADNNDDND